MTNDTLLLGQLAEEFTARIRGGELPNAEDYAQRHPELAERIRQLFPTLMFLEGMAGNQNIAAASDGACHDIAPGTLFGSYRIEREIGRGGMGVVYEAVHLALDKHVALKMLPVLGPRDTGPLERFLREAKTAAGLHHTNIVPVFDVGQASGVPYYAMQYIAGRGLDRVLRDLSGEAVAAAPISTGHPSTGDAPTLPHVPSSEATVADVATGVPDQLPKPQRVGTADFFTWVAGLGIQAAQGLDYAHQRGVVHRDIKPSNLILDEQAILWITDFGLARRTDDVSMTHTGAVLGTPRYMSPEQAESHRQPVDHRTDIYSLAATLYELLTRRPVFDGQTPQQVLMQILSREPVAPRRLNPAVPRDLETIVLKAMAKRSQDRYATAGELADDLGRWLKMEPVRARRIGPLGRTVRWCRRNPALAGLTLVAAAALLLGTLVSGYFAVQATRRADEAQQSAELARIEKLRADEHAAQAIQEREAAQDNLYRGLYEQARAIRTSQQPGRRWEVLSLVEQAERLRTRDRHGVTLPDVNSSGMPSRADLRTEAVAVLVTPDVRLRREVNLGTTGFPVAVSADGSTAVGVAIELNPAERLKGSTKGARIGLRLVDLIHESEPLLHMWTKPEHTTFCPALSADGKTLATLGPKITGRELSGLQVRPWAVPAFEQAPQVLDAPLTESARTKLQEILTGARLAFSPDDKHLLVTFYDQAILWNLESGAATTLNRAVSTPDLRNPWMAMRGAFSPDSQRLALQTGDRQVSLWKTDALDSPITIDLSMPVHGQISFSSSEPLLAIYCLDAKEKKCEVVVWDYAKSEQRTRIATSFPVGTVATALAFDPQGRRLAVSERAGVSIYDLAQSTPLLQWPAHPLGITQLAWGADGQQLISTGIDGKLKIWELSTQPMLTQISTGTPLEGFVFSPDGRWLAVTPSGGGAIELVDRENDKPLRQISTHGAIVFRRDGQQLTAIPTDAIKDIMQLMQPGATKAAAPVASVVVEDTLSGREVSQGTVEGSVLAAAFTPGGDLLVSTFHPQDGSSAIRNINTNEMVWKSADGSRILPLLNADGTLSALAEVDVLQTKPLTIWDLAAGRQLAQWTPPGFSPYLAFSPDNRWAAVVSVNLAGLFLPTGGNTGGEASRELGQMLVTTWSLPAGERQLTIPCNSPYRSLAFSPDGRLLAMTSTEDGVQLWSTERNEPVFRLTPAGGASQSMAFAPDGRLAWCVESQPQIHLLDLSALREQLARIHLDW